MVRRMSRDGVSTGTTTATVLTRAIFGEGCKSVAAGMNPMDLRRGINLAVDKVLDDLKSRAKMISTTEEIAQVRFAPANTCHVGAWGKFFGDPFFCLILKHTLQQMPLLCWDAQV